MADTRETIKQKSKAFSKDDPKNANNLLDIIASLENDNDKILAASIRSLHKIFVNFIKEKAMLCFHENDENLSAKEKYSFWLGERYSDTYSKMFELLYHDSSNIQELALCTLMKFVEAEGNSPLKNIPASHIHFPSMFFGHIVRQLCNSSHNTVDLIDRFQEFLEYDDVRYSAMKTTLKQLQDLKSSEDNGCYLNNVFALLKNLSIQSPESEDGHLDRFISKAPDKKGLKINTYKEHKKLFTTLWLEFLKKKLPTSLYKKVLVILHEKVMPYMTNPLLLSDFLTQSYNIGGVISLLALNGIFILVNNFNLDYPDFYKKLYALFEPSIFHVKYQARFFFLADLFLTSSHLPVYLVAAFVKRLARLSLTAPPSGLTITIPLIFNLLTRHPSCKTLLFRPDGPHEMERDPYDMGEPDMAKCKALESMLWELKSLQEHYYHKISQEAIKAEQPLSKIEIDLSELLETTIDGLFDQEKNNKVKVVPTTFEPPKGLFGNKEDKLAEFWSVSD